MSFSIKKDDKQTDRFKQNLKNFNEFIIKNNSFSPALPFHYNTQAHHDKKKDKNCDYYREEKRKRPRLHSSNFFLNIKIIILN